MKRTLLLLTLGGALALGACSKGAEQKTVGAGKAEGDILPGSISDAQLPLDTVKSQSPLAPKVEGEAKPKDKAKDAVATAEGAAEQEVQAPAAEDKSAEQ